MYCPVPAFGDGQGWWKVVRAQENPEETLPAGRADAPVLALDLGSHWLTKMPRDGGSPVPLRQQHNEIPEMAMAGPPAGGRAAVADADPVDGRGTLYAYRGRDGELCAGFIGPDENRHGDAIPLEKPSTPDPAAESCAVGFLFVLAGDEDGRLRSQQWRPAFGWEEPGDGPAGPGGMPHGFAVVGGRRRPSRPSPARTAEWKPPGGGAAAGRGNLGPAAAGL